MGDRETRLLGANPPAFEAFVMPLSPWRAQSNRVTKFSARAWAFLSEQSLWCVRKLTAMVPMLHVQGACSRAHVYAARLRAHVAVPHFTNFWRSSVESNRASSGKLPSSST